MKFIFTTFVHSGFCHFLNSILNQINKYIQTMISTVHIDINTSYLYYELTTRKFHS